MKKDILVLSCGPDEKKLTYGDLKPGTVFERDNNHYVVLDKGTSGSEFLHPDWTYVFVVTKNEVAPWNLDTQVMNERDKVVGTLDELLVKLNKGP